jgi:hypothetical protein
MIYLDTVKSYFGMEQSIIREGAISSLATKSMMYFLQEKSGIVEKRLETVALTTLNISPAIVFFS